MQENWRIGVISASAGLFHVKHLIFLWRPGAICKSGQIGKTVERLGGALLGEA